jgi:hypothetical protein
LTKCFSVDVPPNLASARHRRDRGRAQDAGGPGLHPQHTTATRLAARIGVPKSRVAPLSRTRRSTAASTRRSTRPSRSAVCGRRSTASAALWNRDPALRCSAQCRLGRPAIRGISWSGSFGPPRRPPPAGERAAPSMKKGPDPFLPAAQTMRPSTTVAKTIELDSRARVTRVDRARTSRRPLRPSRAWRAAGRRSGRARVRARA